MSRTTRTTTTHTTMTAREFNQNVAKAKRAAREGPVIVTERGVPSHVLLSSEAYERLGGPPRRSALDVLRPPPELRLSDEDEFARELEAIRRAGNRSSRPDPFD